MEAAGLAPAAGRFRRPPPNYSAPVHSKKPGVRGAVSRQGGSPPELLVAWVEARARFRPGSGRSVSSRQHLLIGVGGGKLVDPLLARPARFALVAHPRHSYIDSLRGREPAAFLHLGAQVGQ